MIKYCCFCLIILIIIILNNYYNFLDGGNNLNKINNNYCKNSDLKLIKSTCEFIGLIDFASKDQVINFIKHNFLIKQSFQENLVYIYYSLKIPLKTVISDSKYTQILDKLLFEIDSRFYNIILFDLHNLFNPYSNNKSLWTNKLNEYRIKYQNNPNFDNIMKTFLQFSIDPNSSSLFIKLHDMAEKDNEWKQFQKHMEKTPSNNLQKYYLKHSNSQINNALNLKTNVNLLKKTEDRLIEIIEEDTLSETSDLLVDIIEKNKSNLADIIIQSLLKLSKTIPIYNKIFNDVIDKISNNMYFYNKLCKFKKDNERTCPLNIKLNNKKINCNNKVQYNVDNLNDDGCNKCQLHMNKCKIQLKCLDTGVDDDKSDKSIKEISINSNNIIEQNNCKVNLEPANMDKVQLDKILTKSNQFHNDVFILNRERCQNKSIFNVYQNNINTKVKYKRLYQLKDELLTYVYLPYNDIRILKLDYYINKYPILNFIIGYTAFQKKNDKFINTFKYKYDKSEYSLCSRNNQCTVNSSNFENLFNSNDFNANFDQQQIGMGQSWTDIEKKMYINIKIGKGGFGGGAKDNNSNDITCAEKGGDTIIEFKLDNRNYNWDQTIISYGGEIKQLSNFKFSEKPSMKNRMLPYYHNKGNQHKFYKKTHICGGGGGGCFKQSEFIVDIYTNPFQSASGNKYYNTNLNEFNSEKTIYLKLHLTTKLLNVINTKSGNDIKGANGGKIELGSNIQRDVYNGEDSECYGCGGGGGAKKNDLSNQDSYFGSGGSGRHGAVIILNKSFEEVYNSTVKTKDNPNTYDYTEKIYLKDLTINLGEIFYIISIGGGAGGMSGLITGIGGNGGNIIITKHLYNHLNLDDSDYEDFKNWHTIWKNKETLYYMNDVKRNIKKTLLNKFINDCENSLCPISKISNPDIIKNFINVDNKKYFAFLYDSSFLYKTIINNDNKIYKLYSINQEGVSNNHIYNIKLIKNDNFKCSIELFDKNTNELIDYKTNIYFIYNNDTKSVNIYFNDINNSASTLNWKNDNILKNDVFIINKNSVKFLYDNVKNSFNFRFHLNNNNITNKLWILYNTIQIDTITNSSSTSNFKFECRTTIDPTHINDNFIYFITIKPKIKEKIPQTLNYKTINCVNEKYTTKIKTIKNKINKLYNVLNSNLVVEEEDKLSQITLYKNHFIDLKNEIQYEINKLNKKITILEEDANLTIQYNQQDINQINNIITSLTNIINNYNSFNGIIPQLNIIDTNIYNDNERNCNIQLPIKLTYKDKLIGSNIFVYEGNIYNNINNNILSNVDLRFTELIKNKITNQQYYDVNYLNKNDILEINSIYLSTNNSILNIDDELTLINNALYIISITDIFNNIKEETIYQNFRNKISQLNIKYPAGGQITYYFVYNNSSIKEILLNRTYTIKQYSNNSNKFNIQFIDNFAPYDIIILSSTNDSSINNIRTIFESSKIYDFDDQYTEIKCNNYNDVYNIRTNIPEEDEIEYSDNDQQICCNNINFKHKNLCSSDSLCWFDNNICKSNYIKITYIDKLKNRYYFANNNINDYYPDTKVLVDIIRNSNPFKNNMTIILNKQSIIETKKIIDNIKLDDFYLIGSENIEIEDINNQYKLNIISNKLQLYNNYVNIVDSYGKLQNQLKYVNNINNLYQISNNTLHINFTNKINISKFTIYYISNSDISITLSFINNTTFVFKEDIRLPNTNSTHTKYDIKFDEKNKNFNKINLLQTNYTTSDLYIRNFAIKGKLAEIPSYICESYFTINDNQIKLKLNDYIIFKKHIM